jgi:hypothetical protein
MDTTRKSPSSSRKLPRRPEGGQWLSYDAVRCRTTARNDCPGAALRAGPNSALEKALEQSQILRHPFRVFGELPLRDTRLAEESVSFMVPPNSTQYPNWPCARACARFRGPGHAHICAPRGRADICGPSGTRTSALARRTRTSARATLGQVSRTAARSAAKSRSPDHRSRAVRHSWRSRPVSLRRRVACD